MTRSTNSLRNLLDGVRRSLRRDTALAVLLGALCAIPAALLFTWLLGLVRPWNPSGFGPLLLDVMVVAAVAALVYLGVRRWIDALDETAVAADAESTAGIPAGAVRGVLELERELPAGTSAALAQRAGAEIGRRFDGVLPSTIAASLGRLVSRRRRAAVGAFATLSLATLLLAFVSPDHSRAAWSPLASPVRNLVPPALPPLEVRPGDTDVRRGDDLRVRIAAPGREAVTLHWRMQGDVPREHTERVTGDSATITIARIDAAAEYWAAAPDGATTRHYTVTPTDPLLLSELTIDVVYPQHVERATDHFQGELPPLEVPEGTQLVVRGRATRALGGAGLLAADARHNTGFAVDDDRFSGSFIPVLSGLYAWQLSDAAGGDMAVQPAPLNITIIPDAAPQVDITYPARDTVLDASLRQAIVADARDDFGLASAELVSWRVSRAGVRDADVTQPIELSGDDRALIRGLLDAGARDLVPGDTLKFFLRVTDTSPRRQVAVSRTVSLRLPGMVELREQTAERAESLLEETEQLAATAQDLQRTTQELERRASAENARRDAERQRGSRSGESGEQQMEFEDASASRQMLEKQDELMAQLEEMREKLDAFERAMERAGLRDAELQQRLEEMRELYDEMLTPEMKEKLEELRSALENLDPEALQKALEAMAEQQEQMKEQLDRTLEAMRRAAAEQQMNKLAQEARELATQQQALAESMAEEKPTPQQAEAQKDLAERTQKLGESLEQMKERLDRQGEQQTAESTQEAQRNTAEAGQQMQQAARDAAQQNGEQAAQKGEQAAEQLEQAAQTLDDARQAMAEQWQQEAQQSMDQATKDALSLAERQQQLLDRMKQAEEQQQGSQGQKPPQLPQPGQQGEQQSGEKQSGQQPQPGQQKGQQGQQGKQEGQQGKQGQQGGQQPGQQSGGGSGGTDMQSMRSEQGALQQGLEQLGRNLQENAERSDAVNREVGSALGRANLSMQQTLEELQRGQIPTNQAQQTVDALNRLALSLLNNSQSMGQEGGEGSQAMQQMADLAKKQGSLNGRSNALSPMEISQAARSQQLNRMSAEQMEIARRLGELNRGGKEGLMGDIDALAQEAEEIARQMQNGQMPPEARARQERLFHRMLDAGRSLEKDEVEDERSAERPQLVERRMVDELDAALFRDATRFRAPSADELRSLPPAYRRLILDYFERLNRPLAPEEGPPAR